jgi:GNAT superfamily N-acetyltransferase
MDVPTTVAGLCIRSARGDELAACVEVERRSSARFADVVGLEHWVGDTSDLSLVEAAHAQDLVWVAELDGELVGWCYASRRDGTLFIEQLDVIPEHGRRGIGRVLIEAVADRARDEGLTAVTLTTDTHVVWNRPWYEKLGFVVIPRAEQGPELAAVLEHEAAMGFDLTRRVTMRRDVPRR